MRRIAAGIAQANVAEERSDPDPSIQWLLGIKPGLGKSLGLDEEWAYRVIAALGNYGELFKRRLGKDSGYNLDRGLNALWTRGGLMYAPPLDKSPLKILVRSERFSVPSRR